ncbi:MAG: DUF1840 domain-containing protein [Woeseiaceae bacterium]|nr:DUF1840 domain-containing protein [Woeseiaceae bacterium]MDX2607603.1 DUF1840 domain-containing protein [Woeseiaceae bacterium]
MLITFKTRAYADVTMFGEVALKLIKLMGRRETVPSAIEPEDIPQALKMLRTGIAADDAAAKEDNAEDSDDETEELVSVHNRALPLIELLQAAQKENVPVMWEEGGRAY